MDKKKTKKNIVVLLKKKKRNVFFKGLSATSAFGSISAVWNRRNHVIMMQ